LSVTCWVKQIPYTTWIPGPESEKTNQHSQEEYEVDYESANSIDDDVVLMLDSACIHERDVRHIYNCQVFVSEVTEP